MKTRKIGSRCLIWLGVGSFLLAFGLGVLAHLVKSVGAPDGVVYDGLGRKLSTVPTLIRFLFLGEVQEWAGVGWFCIDFVSFFGLIILGMYLFSLGRKETSTAEGVANGKEQT